MYRSVSVFVVVALYLQDYNLHSPWSVIHLVLINYSGNLRFKSVHCVTIGEENEPQDSVNNRMYLSL